MNPTPLNNINNSNLLQVAIVGGKGQMGKVFHRIFLDVDCDVTIIDEFNSNEYLSKREQALKKFDIIVLAIPIDKTLNLIEQIAPRMNPQSLLMDITSLKKPFYTKMKECCVSAFVGVHPLFGPLEMIKGQKIALIDELDRKIDNKRGEFTDRWIKYLVELFEKVGLKTIRTNALVHDQAMGVVQSLIHFISIAFSATVTKEKEKIGSDLDSLTTHYYLLHKHLAGRLLAQAPELYADISFLNQDILPILENYQEQFGKLISFLKNKERDKFINFFNATSKQEDNKDKAYYKIERIMEYLADLEK